MGIFSAIKDAIFGKKKAAPAPAAPSAPAAAQPAPTVAPAPVEVMEPVDVEAIMEQLAKDYGQPSNWRTSIVDLMKLLGLDSSYAARKELAEELGFSSAYDGSADDNIWLHKQVMKKLAENGGKVPNELKD
ncbi:DUF3597 domain-containing protein [Asticcacaulis endophyticus]|uniref:DUF3597 domain-containing protein n=1 Tax=Asticcacaulis endophyticus TaxID=1395890 RepID=A0A918PZW9_9CAUL|nr:DUF3597 domain-containing protein [Asticcacaulis endophyticus]GGZ26229.1 hypothetical protein GCM10011273_09650 [Asticcacaulis endophyticus]